MLKRIEKEQLAQLGNLEILARSTVEGFITGLHKSPFHGFSVEFAEHRIYNPGESTKHIDWKLYGRSDKMFTKKYEEETNLRCQLVVDISSSMYYSGSNQLSKLEYALLAAASLAELLKKQRDAVGLSLFHEQLSIHTPTKSSLAHHRMLIAEMEKTLHAYNSNNATQTASINCLHEIAELCHKRSLIVLFSDLLDDPTRLEDFMQSIQHLKHNKHEVILFHLLDKNTELEFNLGSNPVNLVDMETGEKIKLHPNEIREKYRENMANYVKEIQLKCAQYQVDFYSIDIHHPIQEVLVNFLIKRQRLY
jgi:uncharacterized protein (DUF58 family)